MVSAPVLAIIVGLPLLGAVITAANRNRWTPGNLARCASAMVAGAFIATVIALAQLSSGSGQALTFELVKWGPLGDITLSLGLLGDSISLWWAVVVTGVGFLIHVYSAAYMAGDPGYGRYFAKLNYFVFAMSLLVLSDNYLGLLIGWANVGVASFMLIGFWNQRPAAAEAAKKAFIVNAFGEVGLILAAVLIFVQFGSFEFDAVFTQVAGSPEGLMTAIGLLLLMAAVAKSAQLPLHTWLPDAMQGPTPVSALIHAATMVTAGVYLVTRSFPIYLASETAMTTLAYVGGASALFGAVVALGQTDIKRILAFSTMSQVGYMMMAAGVGAYTAGMFHFMTHAFFKALLFLGAGIIIHYLNGEQNIRKMGGLGKRLPAVYWMFLIGVVAIAGFPPLAGFFSKEEILHGVKYAGHSGLYVLGIVVAGMTAVYMFRLFFLVFTGEPYQASTSKKKGKRQDADAQGGHHEPGAEMLVPVGVLTVLSVAGGWIAIPGVSDLPTRFLGPVLEQYGTWQSHAMTYGPEVLLVIGVAVIGAVIAYTLFGPAGSRRQAETQAADRESTGVLATGFHFDALYHALVVRPIVGTSRWIGTKMDPLGVDGIVHGVAGLVQWLGGALRTLHSGLVRRYALTVFAGAVGMLAYLLLFV